MKKFIAVIMMSIAVLLISATTVSASSYTVEKGDNLWDIAIEHNTTMQHLMEINELDSTIIQPDRIIIIDKPYIVEKGDTLSGIGKKLDVTVDQLMKWNELDSSLILIGQELTIKKGNTNEEASGSQSKEKSGPTPSVKPEAAKPKAEAKKQVEKAPEKSAQKATTKSVEKSTKQSDEKPSGKTIAVKATAYTAECDGCSGITYTGIDLNKDRNAKVIAVDPNVIPLGTKVYVEGYGHAVAADIGSAIKGNRIDIHLPTKKEAFSWGVRNVNVTIVE